MVARRRSPLAAGLVSLCLVAVPLPTFLAMTQRALRVQRQAEGDRKFMPSDRGTPEYEAWKAQKEKEKAESWEYLTGRNPDGVGGNSGKAQAPGYKPNAYDPLEATTEKWQQEAVGSPGAPKKVWTALDRGTPEYDAYMAEKRKNKEREWEYLTGRNPDGMMGDARRADDPNYIVNTYDPLLSTSSRWQEESVNKEAPPPGEKKGPGILAFFKRILGIAK